MTRPESGRISPMARFRIRLLPEPATPNKALVSPRARAKEIPRSTLFSPKASATFSKTMTGAELSSVSRAAESSGKVGADISLVVREYSHQEAGKEKISSQDEDGCRNHRLRGGAAHT